MQGSKDPPDAHGKKGGALCELRTENLTSLVQVKENFVLSRAPTVARNALS